MQVLAFCRQSGDAKTPLYILIATSIMNIFLDLFFVINLQMGVAGAAWATIISEAISMCLVIYVLMHTDKEYKVSSESIKDGRKVLERDH
jgi:Na+-driven multidrug efflux pump